MLNDLMLLNKIKGGDIKAFESIFKTYHPALCLFAFSITGDKAVAEEIVQDIFYNLWKDRDMLQIFHSLKSYLYKAVKNKSLQYREHLEVRQKHADSILNSESEIDALNPQQMMEFEELQHLIESTIEQLPERRLQIFKMHRSENMKYSEIATALSISVKTVEAEMTKTLRLLRTEVENYIHAK